MGDSCNLLNVGEIWYSNGEFTKLCQDGGSVAADYYFGVPASQPPNWPKRDVVEQLAGTECQGVLKPNLISFADRQKYAIEGLDDDARLELVSTLRHHQADPDP